jgi:hypothetical protein
LLNFRVTHIKINEEFESKQGILDQGATKLVVSTIKITEFNGRPELSLEDNVYP